MDKTQRKRGQPSRNVACDEGQNLVGTADNSTSRACAWCPAGLQLPFKLVNSSTHTQARLPFTQPTMQLSFNFQVSIAKLAGAGDQPAEAFRWVHHACS